MLVANLKHAWRGLARTRVATLAAVVSLGLGIGASVTMFDLVDRVFIRMPLVRQPEGLRRLYFANPEWSGQSTPTSFTAYPVLEDLRAGASSFSTLAAFFRFEAPFGRGVEARTVHALAVSASFFSSLGVTPSFGRTITEPEGDVKRPSFVVLLSHEFWESQFGASPQVLGEKVWIGRDPYTVVGVLPQGFTGIELAETDVWLPLNALARLQMQEGWHEKRGSAFLQLVGRLRPGVTDLAAAQEATAVYRQAYAEAGNPRPAELVTLGPVQRAWGPGAPLDARVSLWLGGLSFVTLLIAAANVISLVVIRTLTRHQELATRSALGASASQLASLPAAEAVILAFLGGAVASGFVAIGHRLCQSFLLPEGVRADALGIRVLVLLSAAILVTAVFCGGVPWLLSRHQTLGQAARSAQPGRRRLQARQVLLAGQVALTLVLLIVASLFIHSLYRATELPLGIDVDRLLVATIDFERSPIGKPQVDEIYRRARDGTRQIPGVERVSLASSAPFVASIVLGYSAPGGIESPDLPGGGPYITAVNSDYFATIGTGIRRGRAFLDRDPIGRAAVVNKTMARLIWAGRDPVGQCLKLGNASAPCATVVGVAEDAHLLAVGEDPLPQFYVQLANAPSALPANALLVRCKGRPATLVHALRRELQSVAPSFSLATVKVMSQLLEPELRPWRLGAAVFSLFGALALILAAVGLYGVISHQTVERAPELCVRLALGAQWRAILWQVLKGSLAAAAIGIALGLAAASAMGDLLTPTLFKSHGLDQLTLVLAPAALLGVGVVASYFPVRHMRRIDLSSVLRGTTLGKSARGRPKESDPAQRPGMPVRGAAAESVRDAGYGLAGGTGKSSTWPKPASSSPRTIWSSRR
jgi:predicted permease